MRLRALRLAAFAVCLFVAACAHLTPAPAPRPAPGLPATLHALVAGFDGKVGVAVEDVQAGWTAGADADAFYPQQSVSKLWTALAVLDAVDRGRMRLTDPVLVTRADLSVFNQPIAAEIGPAGLTTTVGDLMRRAIVQSDNAADDSLIRRVGGPAAVRMALGARGISDVRPGPEERILQSRIAGVDWTPDYSIARAFEIARSLVPPETRATLLSAYVADPPDGATPRALVHALARLQRGELLSAASTKAILDLLAATTTGPLRIKAGLPPGWTLAHKTGTGQDLGDLSTGYNDVGLIIAPDGRRFAVAVMIAATRRPIPERQALMAAVARAVVEAEGGPPAAPQPSAPPPRAR